MISWHWQIRKRQITKVNQPIQLPKRTSPIKTSSTQTQRTQLKHTTNPIQTTQTGGNSASNPKPRRRAMAAGAARAGASAVAWLLAAAVAAALVASASAQSGSGSGCTTTLISLYPCLNYISGNVTTPPSSCCSQLASVVQTNPQCLCAALSGDSSSLGGVTIDKTRALALPQACNVKTPPASKCNSAGGGSGGGATGSATPATTTSSGVPATTGTGSGSKATPTAPFLTSGGASIRRGAVSLVLAFAAVAGYAISAV